MRVVILDDDKDLREMCKNDVAGFCDDLEAPEAFGEIIKALTTRQVDARRGKTPSTNDAAKELDDADLLILDFDLAQAADGTYSTGEALAYLARTFTTAKLILILNQWTDDFDLTMESRFESFADYNVRSTRLSSEGLWLGPGKEHSFCPWRWSPIIRETELVKTRIRTAKKNLGESIFEVFGLRDSVEKIHRAMLSLLNPGDEPQKTTFHQFVHDSGQGLRERENREGKLKADVDRDARIAASRLTRWLKDVLLPPQDVIVDLPHLVERYPFLAKGKTAAAWNKTVWPQEWEKVVSADGLRSLKRHYAKDLSAWLGRPVFFSEEIRQDAEFFEALRSTDKSGRFAFCEDTSRFESESDTKEFRSLLSGPHARRHVSELADDGSYVYEPRSFLAR